MSAILVIPLTADEKVTPLPVGGFVVPPMLLTEKLPVEVAVPPAVVTVSVPVVAPVGTVVVIDVAVAAVTVACVPLNLTVLLAAVVLKLLPLIVTEAPTAPLVGEKEYMAGTTEAIIFITVSFFPFTTTFIGVKVYPLLMTGLMV